MFPQISHAILSPFPALIGFLDLAMSRYGDEDLVRVRRSALRAHVNARALLALTRVHYESLAGYCNVDGIRLAIPSHVLRELLDLMNAAFDHDGVAAQVSYRKEHERNLLVFVFHVTGLLPKYEDNPFDAFAHSGRQPDQALPLFAAQQLAKKVSCCVRFQEKAVTLELPICPAM